MSVLWVAGLMFVSTMIGAAGLYKLKKGLAFSSIREFLNFNFIFGAFLMALAVLSYAAALFFGDLSLIYPFSALTYVWTAFLSKRLDESLSLVQWLGIVIVVLGVFLVGFSV